MPINPTRAIISLADQRDDLTNGDPPSLTELAAHVALLEAAMVTLAQYCPGRDTLRGWLTVAAMPVENDSPAGNAIRVGAQRLKDMLCDH